MKTIEGFCGHAYRGVEAKSNDGSREVVVDRLGDTNNGQALAVEPQSNGERSIAADHDEPVKLQGPKILDHLIGSILVLDSGPVLTGNLNGCPRLLAPRIVPPV